MVQKKASRLPMAAWMIAGLFLAAMAANIVLYAYRANRLDQEMRLITQIDAFDTVGPGTAVPNRQMHRAAAEAELKAMHSRDAAEAPMVAASTPLFCLWMIVLLVLWQAATAQAARKPARSADA